MDDVEARKVAESGPVVGDDRAQPIRIGGQTDEVVVAGTRVDRYPRLPISEVGSAEDVNDA
jgi:hypothetical protein